MLEQTRYREYLDCKGLGQRRDVRRHIARHGPQHLLDQDRLLAVTTWITVGKTDVVKYCGVVTNDSKHTRAPYS